LRVLLQNDANKCQQVKASTSFVCGSVHTFVYLIVVNYVSSFNCICMSHSLFDCSNAPLFRQLTYSLMLSSPDHV
jgi:hypothetical protein